MDRYILDTSVILAIIEGNKQGIKAEHIIRGKELITSTLCYCEVLNKYNIDKLKTAEAFLSAFIVYPVLFEDAKSASKIAVNCRKRGMQVGVIDCVLAGISSNKDLTILTLDSDFERIEGIKKIIL